MKAGFALLTLFAGVTSAQSPSAAQLQAALDGAKTAWGVKTPAIETRLEPLSPTCKLKDGPRTAQAEAHTAQTVLTFDDGTQTFGDVVTQWVIVINSSCDWASPDLSLRNTMVHEVGHILYSQTPLGLAYHSPDKNSVMFWAVNGKQTITPEDRARLTIAAVAVK